MTVSLAHRAETLRLARVLGVEPEALDFLADAPVEALAELRGAVLDRLLERNRDEFGRAVALAGYIPRALAASLAQRAMGPVLCGRAAALLTAEMAAELAARLPAGFLADVSRYVDLRHVGPLIGGIPTETMAAVGRIQRQREEWIVLAAFVGHVPTPKLKALLGLFDGEALLRAGFVFEDLTRLDPVLALLPAERIDELAAVAQAQQLWPEAIAIAVNLGSKQRNRVIDHLNDEQLDELLDAAHREQLWAESITFAAQLGARQRKRVIAAIERLDEPALADLAALLRADALLRDASSELIERAPAHLRARLDNPAPAA